MIACDMKGRPYARVSEVKAGTIVEHDGGSSCWTKPEYEIKKDEFGDLWFECSENRHYLFVEEEHDEMFDPYYVGIYLKKD